MSQTNLPISVLIHLGLEVKKIYSLADMLCINGKRVAGIRSVQGKAVYDISGLTHPISLKPQDRASLRDSALGKYLAAESNLAPEAKKINLEAYNLPLLPANTDIPNGNHSAGTESKNTGLMWVGIILALILVYWLWANFFRDCSSAFEAGWRECRSDYNGQCHYLGNKYKPFMCFAGSSWSRGSRVIDYPDD